MIASFEILLECLSRRCRKWTNGGVITWTGSVLFTIKTLPLSIFSWLPSQNSSSLCSMFKGTEVFVKKPVIALMP